MPRVVAEPEASDDKTNTQGTHALAAVAMMLKVIHALKAAMATPSAANFCGETNTRTEPPARFRGG
jgi:hypothetical protein